VEKQRTPAFSEEEKLRQALEASRYEGGGKPMIKHIIDTATFLHWLDKHNLHTPQHYLDLTVADTVIGAFHQSRLPLLAEHPHVFQLHDGHVALHPRLDTPAARTDAVVDVLREWREAGLITGWRDEVYRVSTTFDAPALMMLERAAASTFGILRYGVHLNGIVRKNGHLHLWIARRSLDKPEFPGKLDHIVAGGIPAGYSARDVVLKECQEEANIPLQLARRARPISLISYRLDEDAKRKRSLIFVYDLELPEDFQPENTDGEVAAFYLWPIECVIEALATDDFKTNNTLVFVDFLMRYGYLGPDDPHYTEIAQRLRSPVTW